MTSHQEDIAIVGIACRFPGEASSPEKFLSMLKNGRDAWSKIPKDRFDISAYHHPSHERQGNIVADGGHFLEEDVGLFDAPFFSMTTAEANAMDPQQRLILESTYECLDSAGIPMESLIGSQTSVYVGCFTRDYEAISARQIDDTLLYQATGQGLAMLSNRLSWFYDLKGPSLTLDTACSSSLLALHLACQSIRSGESTMSIVGGTGLILLPDIMRTLTALHFLSPDSRCYSFDERANGYARGEGIGTLVLKTVSDAIRDGDTIRAVIRGTQTNQDGRTPGITLPSSEAQASLIASTYRAAGLDYRDTQYFEAHGTGTPAGDPLELGALGSTFGKDSERDRPLLVGSVKTNIGHLEGAAGIGGLFKAILSLETGWIFPTLNFEKPNPRLKLKEWNVEIATQLTPWPTSGTRRVSVNSFGYGGSNAHVIVDDAYHYLQERGLTGFTNTSPRLPTLTPTTEGSQDSGFASAMPTSSPNQASDYFPSASLSTRKLFVLSAPDQASLGRLSSTYSTYVADNTATASDNTFLDNLAHTLGNRRSTFMWKQAVVAATGKELTAALSSSQPVRTAKAPRICLVFTGQGAQWAGMGRELLQHNVHLRHIQRADAFIKSLGAKWSVLDELNAGEDTSRINDPEFAQPLCTILQTALVELLAHWGVKPASVVGHSSGEIGAAFAAGSLTEVDAWTLSYYRGIAAKRISTVAPHLDGSMTATGLSEEAVQKYITDLGLTSSVVVACINSPASVTLSGDATSLGVIEERLQADGVFNRRLKVSTAYHSPHMQHVAQQYKSDISAVKPRDSESGCTFYSSLTGTTRPGSTLDAEYWVQNMTEPVRFFPAVMQMLPDTTLKRRERRKQAAGAIDTFIEIGPAAALQGPLRQILASNEGAGDFTLRSMLGRGKDATETSLELMGKLWSMGAPIDFATVNDCSLMPSPKQALCNTPRYPWNHATRYWHESAVSRNHRFPKAPRLDLLGAPCEEWNPSQPAWRNMLRISELPWIKEHMVHDSIIFPGAGYICAVLEGARQIANPVKTPKQFELRDILIGRALEFDGETDVVELVTAFKPRKLGLKSQEAPWMEWTCYSNSDRGHIEHCSGLLFIHYEADASEIEGGREAILRNSSLAGEYHHIDAAIETTIAPADLYAKLASIGLNYGPLFQGMTVIKAGNGAGVTRVELQDTKAAMPMEFEYDHLLHPSTLDACFQSIFTAFLEQANQKLQAMVPTAIEAVRVSANLPKGAGSTLHGFAKGRRRGFREAMGSLYMSDESWTMPLIEVENIACTELGALTGGQASQETDALHKVQATWHWNVDPSMLTKDTAHELISMPQAEFDARVDSFVDLTVMGEKLAAIFGKRALQKMTKEEEENLSPHLKLYVEWLKSENEKASRGELQLQYGQNDWVTMTYEEEEEYIASLTNASIDAKLLIAVGRELNGILNGTVPPLTVMMQDNLLFDFYANAVGMDVSTDQIEKVFDLKAHQQPAMNILEIGAGTASISKPILQRLANHHGSTIRCSSYVFTDISSGFFEAAEKKLKEWANVVSYRRLDIEQDPIEQGFEAESFDVIAATNVLHATKNMNNTLQNVLKLLKPGGQLVLGEITFPRARLSMIYGTLSGWWLSEDGRTGGPCMTVDQWKDILTNNGFDFDYSIRDVPRDDIHLMSTICATKRSDSPLPFKKTIVVTANDASPDVGSLVESLKSSLASDEHAIECISIADVHKPAEEEGSPFEGSAIISLLEIERPFLQNLDERQLEAVQQVLLKSSASLWITRGDLMGENDPSFRLVDGLLRVIRNEDETLRVHSLDLPKTGEFSTATVISDWFKSVMIRNTDTAETEVAYSDGKYLIPRLYDDTAKNYDLLMRNDTRPPVMQPLHQEERPLRLTIGVPGMLDTLHFVDDEVFALPLEADEVEFSVRATAVNFVDLMISLGIVPDTLLGCDAAGVIVRVGSEVTSLQVGDKVACLGLGAHRNVLRSKAALCQKIPDNMSFEDASTLPTIYVTAYQSLVEIGRLRKGETILIHAAAGGLGQAAIQLAQHIGAEIYATVGSVSKKKLIMESYGIPETHIFNSRDMTFAQAVLRSTNGQGVDVVLNSLAGEALRKTWTCIKSFGRFIEVGKKDILNNSGLEMSPFLHNVTFAGVNVEGMFRNNKPLTAEISQKVFDLVRDGSVGVVHPVTVYCVSEVEKAFRTMQQGKHSGKLVLSFDNKEAQVPVVPRDPHPLQLSPDVTYLLVGGLGGLGRAQAVWLAENGAKHIAFVSRSGASSDTAQQTMEKLKGLDVDARAYPCDIAEPKKLAETLAKLADEMPRIAGVIQGAMVLSDSFFANMTLEQMNTALRPKVQGSWNLHDLLPKDLDFFIMLSSLAGVCGSRGQCNYAMGNTYQGALAAHRHQQGLKATVLDLGIMAGYGFVEENKDNAAIANLANSLGKLAIQPDEFFSILKSSITGYADGEIPMATHASLGAGTGGMVNAYKLNDGYDFYWHNNIPFSYIRHLDTLDTKALGGAGDEEFRAALQSAATSSEAVEVIQEALTAKLAKAMMIPLEDIDLTKPVSAYGVDSLVAVEVRNWISREMKSDLSVFDILSPIPMVQLANKIASKSSLLSAEYRAEAGKDAGDATEQAPAAE